MVILLIFTKPSPNALAQPLPKKFPPSDRADTYIPRCRRGKLLTIVVMFVVSCVGGRRYFLYYSYRRKATRLRGFLSRDSLPYIIIRRIIPGPKTPFATQLLRNTDVTMARSGFGPYHGQWLDDAPTKRIGVIPTPWMMMLCQYLSGARVVSAVAKMFFL